MDYKYKEGKQRIIDILHSKTKIEKVENIPESGEAFTYSNGIKSWVGAMFIDMRDSTSYFKDNKSDIVARVMRAFCSEIIGILKSNPRYRQIGIRGDCVYAIYSAPKKQHLKDILSDAIFINTFQKMFQQILEDNNFPTFEIGIGLGTAEDLIIRAGKKGTGISDYIWIGDSVIDASKLSNQGNCDGFDTIVMNSCFYDNIKDFKANDDYKYSYYFKEKYSDKLEENVYHGDMINIDFNDWIDGGMR